MKNAVRSFLVLASLATASHAIPAEPSPADGSEQNTGTVEGTVLYRADPKRPWPLSRYYIHSAKEGFLAESVVALEGPALATNAAPCSARNRTMDQVNFQFVPETMVIRAGDSVHITNSDEALHNVTTMDGGSPFNLNVAKSQELAHTFEHAGGLNAPIRLSCVFHGGMRAWIYVFDHPWFQLTERDGHFRLEKVPAGMCTLGVIHPAGKLRYRQQIEVKPNATVQVEIILSPDNLIGLEHKGI